MGAWGHEPFANDSALDWASDLYTYDDSSVLMSACMAIITNDEYLDADECSAAIAAAEVVAALKGNPGNDLPEQVKKWVAKHPFQPDEALVARTLEALARIEQSSELQELWAETGIYNMWRSTIQDVRARLGA